ncbi:amidohydrolase family protein [Corynebacterium kozikiae]|uniref:amidohydrolase family protein n=1 Tax=Corynebacterium kozikiae TaxID=2968469 RepID=UPI00211BF4CB|nr:amidohydrolase family protein [Corynebacterium sp. 76QC2CO]MCQ9342305.1 amidohydrolase [Corynebacterium sp. 76QC2CO]
MNAIDTHAHFYPTWYLDELERAGVSPDSTAIARGLHADTTASDIEKRLEWMDRAGVEAQVIAVTPQGPHVADGAKATHLAEAINEHYLEIAAAHPGRFLPYAALPLPHVGASVHIIEQAQGFLGFSVPTLLPGGGSLFGEELEPVWEALNQQSAVVNIHPTGQGLCAAPITEHHLHWVNGAPVEDATAVLHLLKAGINLRYPKITFHVAHLGGDLAFLARRLEDNFEDWDAFPASPMQALRGMVFDAANFHEPALLAAVATYGPEQVMAGSDFPYFQEEKYVRAFEYIRSAGLSEEVKAKILRSNAARVLGLELQT